VDLFFIFVNPPGSHERHVVPEELLLDRRVASEVAFESSVGDMLLFVMTNSTIADIAF
jgi:hypothetical protein